MKKTSASLSNQNTEHAKIDERLKSLGINTDQFGFFDNPAFVNEERRDGEFLNQYALWVQSRPRTAEYDQRVNEVVPKLTEFLAQLFAENEMRRSCVHLSSMMQRILDRLGIWSFCLHGAMVAEVGTRDLWRGQAVIDVQDFPGAAVGHAWLVAPPYIIVDGTIQLQNPKIDPITAFIPKFIAVDDALAIQPTAEDMISAEVRSQIEHEERRRDPNLHHRLLPHLKEFARNFDSYEVRIGELSLRYMPCAVRISDAGLEHINQNGEKLTGLEVWRDHVAPAFSSYVIP